MNPRTISISARRNLSTLLLTLLAATPRAAADPEPRGQWSPHGARLDARVAIPAPRDGFPWIHLDEGRPLRIHAANAKAAARLSLAEPRSLAAADFDGDGMPDLAAGYVAGEGGLVVLYRGNVDAVYPNAPEAQERRKRGTFTEAPFLAPARVFALPAAADFLAAGDFDADGRFDVVAAARGGGELHWLPGDGEGRLGEARAVAAGGRITAFASGEVNRRDGLADLAVAVDGDGGPRVMIFAGSRGAMRAVPESAPLPAAASGLALGPFAGDWPLDVAATAGDELVIVHGCDRARAPADAAGGSAKVERIPLGFAALALAYGDFVQNDGAYGELALYSDAGEVRFLNRGGDRDTWTSDLAMPVFGARAAGKAPALVPVRVSSLPGDDLAVAGSSADLELLVPGALTAAKAAHRVPALAEPLLLAAAAPVVAVLPMRLNPDALTDLVVLTAGAGEPVVLQTKAGGVFTVTSTGTDGDCSFGDGACTINNAANPVCVAGNACNPALGCELAICTLRAAIDETEALPGADAIHFNVGGGGHQTLVNVLSLGNGGDNLTDAVTLDGTTQPGFAGTPLIELKAPTVGDFSSCIVHNNSSNSVLRGLAINETLANAICMAGGSGNIVEGNFLGTDVTGTSATFAGGAISYGIFTQFLGGDNLIGGTTAAARNLISGTTLQAVRLGGSASAGGNRVQGNYVGTDVTGTVALGNGGDGIVFGGGLGGTVVGGTAPGAGNLVAGNAEHGIFSPSSTSPGSLVQGNLVGTDASGTVALGNGGTGIRLLTASPSTIGGTSPASRNIVAGSGQAGVHVDSDGDVVRGNFIGTNAAGADLGNTGHGVEVNELNAVVGGTGPGEGNVIAWNGGDGVFVGGGFFPLPNNAIRGNSIHSNSGLGIDGALDGVTPNGGGLTNYPVLAAAETTGSTYKVAGTLDSAANAAFTLDFYANPACDPSGHGEGRTWLGSIDVVTDASGTATFTAGGLGTVGVADAVTATATDAAGTTGELSACATATSLPAEIFADGFESGDLSVWSAP